MAISAVGAWSQAGNTTPSNPSSMAVSPAALGNGIVLALSTSSPTLTGTPSAGGCGSNWQKLVELADSGRGQYLAFWLGTVGTLGASSISVTYSRGLTTGESTELDVQEFTAGLGANTVWSVDNAQTGTTSVAPTPASPISSAALTPSAAGDLFLALFQGSGSLTPGAGSQSGWTYHVESYFSGVYAFNPAYGSSAGACTVPFTGASGGYSAVDVLVKASVPATVIPQQPRVYGQAVARSAFY